MIVRRLLIAGMLAGLGAGLLAAVFARLFVEPSIDLAIGFEAAHGMTQGPELVSRAVQKGAGLTVAATAYSAALGGIFSLVFAGLYGRIIQAGTRAGSLWLATCAFITISLVPALKYPPNPPAVGSPDTIGIRTATFFAMIALSIVAAALATRFARARGGRLGSLDAGLVAVGIYIVAVAIAAVVLPAVDEVPRNFPASLLWSFRLGSLSTQALLWASLGLLFGKAAERILERG